MQVKRGRPANTETIKETVKESKPSHIYTQIFTEEDGVKHVWTYNTKIDKVAPISVDVIYPKNYDHTPAVNDNFSGIQHCIGKVKTVSAKEIKKALKKTKVPLSKQKFVNPANGKKVGYARAKALGLI